MTRPAMRAVVAGAFTLFGALPAAAQTHLVIVSGLGGEPKYSRQFDSLSTALAAAAHARFGIPDSAIAWLGEDSTSHEPHYRGQSTRANIEAALSRLAARARPGEQIVLVLIGHGSGDGDDAKISVPGPDPTARDFAAMLARFSAQKIAFVDLTSASGDMLPVLATPNRVIITATKSNFERNESHFAEFFVHALTADGADVDKDGRVSLLEAFRYAAVETKRVYDNASKLQTEHAQLDDQGAKTGVPMPDGRSGEGLLARRFYLDANYAATGGASDARLATLYTEKGALEDKIDQLRTKKTSMSDDAYDDALEDLLVQLALNGRSIRAVEGGKS